MIKTVIKSISDNTDFEVSDYFELGKGEAVLSTNLF